MTYQYFGVRLAVTRLGTRAPTLFLCFSVLNSNYSNLSSFPLDSPFDPPQRPPTRALIRRIRLRTKLNLIYLQRTKQRARRQCERDLRRARRARVCIAARESAPERRGADRTGDGTGSAGGGRGGRGEGPTQRASWRQVHPLAATCSACARRSRRSGAEIELDGDVLERACAGCECQLECAWVVGQMSGDGRRVGTDRRGR